VNALMTRASIEKDSFKGMDCRVKPGNDTARMQRRKHPPAWPSNDRCGG
jgi:hypothetical protein